MKISKDKMIKEVKLALNLAKKLGRVEMEDKKLRKRMNKIRDAMTIITNEINAIYNDNAETKPPRKQPKKRKGWVDTVFPDTGK